MTKQSLPRARTFDQCLLDGLVDVPVNGLRSRGLYLGLRGLRRLRLLVSDPVVSFALGECTLRLPLSHELPYYRRAFPEYALNLGRVAFHVRQKYPALTMIDVGANVGDTVAVVRKYSDHPILSIEGEPAFFRLLTENTRDLDEIELEETFLGAMEDHVNEIHKERGNARITLGGAPGKSTICTLSAVVSRHARFATSKLLKLDAEGFDCRIIACESEFLARSKPVLFFEYYPTCCKLTGQEPFPVFSQLTEMGYCAVLIYRNVGRYLMRLNLSQVSELESFHRNLVGLKGFCDLAAFHKEDLDIASKIEAEELV